jgi:hypothetical protein
MRETTENCVIDARPQFSLRGLRDHMMQPLALALIGGLAMILTLVVPDGATAPLRFVCWGLVVIMTYGAGHCIQTIAQARLTNVAVRSVISLGLTALSATLIVLGLRWLILSDLPQGRDLAAAAVTIAAIAAIIAGLFRLRGNHAARQHPASRRCRLLDRLPLDKRAAMVALSVEDHYVRIGTTKGEEMLLMRLSDAIKETGDTRGLQVHRAHWVALDQVTAARRKGDGAILSMQTGPDIPVSRANMPAIREAGLLPR